MGDISGTIIVSVATTIFLTIGATTIHKFGKKDLGEIFREIRRNLRKK